MPGELKRSLLIPRLARCRPQGSFFIANYYVYLALVPGSSLEPGLYLAQRRGMAE